MIHSARQERLQIDVLPELKKAVRRGALQCEETRQTFILRALQRGGVPVPDDELVDHRKVLAR
jgi:hypothetical protein